jgi:hypothetical protein
MYICYWKTKDSFEYVPTHTSYTLPSNSKIGEQEKFVFSFPLIEDEYQFIVNGTEVTDDIVKSDTECTFTTGFTSFS